MDKKIFIKGFRKLCFTFSHIFNKDQATVYFEVLHPMPNDKFIASVDEICQTGKFFPKPVEILKATFKNVPEHIIAQEILDVAADIGSYGTPKYKHKLSEMIAADIGYLSTCMNSEDENRKLIHFKYEVAAKEYEDAMTTGRNIAIESGALKGRIEIHNDRLIGPKKSGPVGIGEILKKRGE